ncbi:MAG TPA: DUF4175 family protein, partial [Candidatus Omnitrophota bacterium]|nr:DUF4175 family protein [Candidatus Omnitrophota bacterium]
SDDWGLAKAWAEIRRIEEPGGDTLRVDLPLPGGRPRNADMTSWHDLTAHPWAGLPVTVTPVAEDALGQGGRGPAITLTLPERSFTHPVARALVEQRRLLTEDRGNALGAVELLDGVTSEPRLIGDDLKVFLALRTARAVLSYDGFDLADAQDLLWNAALRLEEGDLAEAERSLEDARRRLEQAVDGNASNAEMQQALAEFQAAMMRYLQAMAEQMARNGQQPMAPSPDARVIGAEELAQMMQSMQDMAQTGARDALKQMLQDLNQMLSNLQSAPPPPQSAAMGKAMRDLAELTKRQQQMLDHSFQQSQQGGQQPGNGAAEAQEALRKSLGEIARQMEQGLGEAPSGLGEAGEAMGQAAGTLRRDQWEEAGEHQAQAVQQLQQAARQAAEQMGMAGQGGLGMVPRDPMGRPMTGSGFGDDGTTRIPGQSDIQRAREILDELRRRAGEWQRPEQERDYLNRLLKQF